MKRIALLFLLSLTLVGCGKKDLENEENKLSTSETISKFEEIVEVETIDSIEIIDINENDIEISMETIDVESVIEESIKEETIIEESIEEEPIDIIEDNIISINFFDDGIPGSSYNFSIDLNNRIVDMDITHFSSAIDVETTNIVNTIQVYDDDIWNQIVMVLDTNILELEEELSELGMNDYNYYKYKDLVGLLCFALSDIEVAQTDNVIHEKTNDIVEYWDNLYGWMDLNGDGVVTSKEDFTKTIDIIMSEIK